MANDDPKQAGKPDEPAKSVEESCNMWDWARTAGISRDELRKAIEQARKECASTRSAGE